MMTINTNINVISGRTIGLHPVNSSRLFVHTFMDKDSSDKWRQKRLHFWIKDLNDYITSNLEREEISSNIYFDGLRMKSFHSDDGNQRTIHIRWWNEDNRKTYIIFDISYDLRDTYQVDDSRIRAVNIVLKIRKTLQSIRRRETEVSSWGLYEGVEDDYLKIERTVAI